MKPLLPLLLPFCLSACSLLVPIEDDPVRHLLEASVSGKTPTAANPSIAIARPSLPPYLERVELVTRTGDGRLEVHEKNLWSEPLDAAITRVVAGQPTPPYRIHEYPAVDQLHHPRLLGSCGKSVSSASTLSRMALSFLNALGNSSQSEEVMLHRKHSARPSPSKHRWKVTLTRWLRVSAR